MFTPIYPPRWRATMARFGLLLPSVMRRSLRLLVLLTLLVICAQAQAQNKAATGAPAVTAADSADLTMVGAQ